MKKYKLIDHTGDLGIEVYGHDERELFENAALAVIDIVLDAGKITEKESIEITVDGLDINDLLVNWLSEILFSINVKHFCPIRCDITEIDQLKLVSKLYGEKIDTIEEVLKKELKAVTYHKLDIRKTKGGIKTEIVFDI